MSKHASYSSWHCDFAPISLALLIVYAAPYADPTHTTALIKDAATKGHSATSCAPLGSVRFVGLLATYGYGLSDGSGSSVTVSPGRSYRFYLENVVRWPHAGHSNRDQRCKWKQAATTSEKTVTTSRRDLPRVLELAPARWATTLEQSQVQQQLDANIFRRATLLPNALHAAA